MVVLMVAVAGTPEAEVEGARAGGGGFHGGGGFQTGGFHGGGQVTHGVGSRGGGVGFGGMRMPNGVPNFEGAGPRFSSFGHPSHTQQQVGGARAQASRPEVARQSDQRFSSLRNHIVARHDPNWHNDWDRRHVHFNHGRFFVFVDGFWCGLDDGFFPWITYPITLTTTTRTIITRTLTRTITTGPLII